MMAAPLSTQEQIAQLESARKLVFSDANYYQQVIQGILPIIGRDASVELRRWGADFLSDTFASPLVPRGQKETLALVVLETLRLMIENPQEDAAVVKSIVQTAASIYPMVIGWIINSPWDDKTWENMTAIKTRILRIWDSAPTGVRLCCIKFAQKVVLVQTASPDVDTRRDPNEVALSMVPPNHPLIPPRNLEAESSGLLDRMLGVFQENLSDAVLIDATLNSLCILIRARPHLANKILSVILNFNPLKQANSPMTPKLRVIVKSMEKTTRILLLHINKRDPHGPLAQKIQHYIERNARSQKEIFEDANKKRGLPDAASRDIYESAKRQKIIEVPKPSAPVLHIPPLTPGPHTIAELFTITTDSALKSFDVSLIGEDMAVRIGVNILQRIDVDTLNQAIEGVRARYKSLIATPLEEINAATAPLGLDDDDDDYDPDQYNAEDTEQILNKLDSAPPKEPATETSNVALGNFTLPAPPPLTLEQITQVGKGTVSRVFDVMATLNEPGKKTKSGMNRLAASAYDRDAWITIITRLATRAACGLEPQQAGVKEEDGSISLSDVIRESLFNYVLEDFRKRIDIAVAWLCEEWYNDKIQSKQTDQPVLHYGKWVLKVLDGIIPYLDVKDKILTRFLSEIPELSKDVLDRVKSLCRDPGMVNLALTSLLYLVMMRPPMRDAALDAVEDIWQSYDEAKAMAAKYLSKWRPGFENRLDPPKSEEDMAEGVMADAAKVAAAVAS